MKILIIHASAGQGHKRAAEAIFESIKQNSSHSVSIIDSLDFTNPLFKFIYIKGYAFLVTHFPFVWRFFYRITDNPASKFVNPFFGFFNKNLNSLRLKSYLNNENPDLIISTHFFFNEFVSEFKNKGIIKSRFICVITDFLVHYYWVSEAVDIYVVACQKTKEQLLNFGIPEEKIKIFGIPVDMKFQQELDKSSLQKKFSLEPEKFTLLVVTGAFGFKSIEEVVNLLKNDVQLLIICGNNKKLFKKLSALKNNGNLKVFGFVNNMHELMTAADLIITKPGGLTISEAVVKKLPMIFISPIPGQETNNARFFEDQGLGFNVERISQIKDIVLRFKTDKEYFEEIKMRLAKFSHYQAAKEILKIIE